jgi:glutamate/tyrosine decarboxylase-like PLP-dependent enzyme
MPNNSTTLIDTIKITELEKIARQLEPDADRRKKVREGVLAYTEQFLNNIISLPAWSATETEKEFDKKGIIEEPIPINEVISLLETGLDKPGLNPASGGHLGYIPGGGIYYSALGDYWADITNRYAGIFFAGPGAVKMENELIRWAAELVGYPPESAGNLASGGSIANLIAIVTARDYCKITSSKVPKAVIYLSNQAHHCIFKAIRIAGLSECIIRYLPLDANYRIISVKLDNAIKDDIQNGFLPFLVIASAGTTDTGAIDPLEDIGTIAKKHNLWYHIDAAYGGFFVLTDYGKKALKGMELSDSIVIDPHKGLFLPYGLGMVLVKNKEALMQSHYYKANYMQDALFAKEEISPADVSPELTKPFRGLRLWLPLKLLGLAPFRACLEEKLLLARYFYEKVKELGFETGPYPDLSVVAYRYVPKNQEPNEFNKRLLEEILNDGRIFISSTMIEDRFMLRLAVLSFRTHLREVDILLELLKKGIGIA